MRAFEAYLAEQQRAEQAASAQAERLRREQEASLRQFDDGEGNAFASTQRAIHEIPADVGGDVNTAANESLAEYLAGSSPNGSRLQRAAATARSANRVMDYANTIQNVMALFDTSSRPIDRVGAGTELGVLGLESNGVFSPLRAVTVAMAMGIYIKVIDGGLKDLDRAMSALDVVVTGALGQQNLLLGQQFHPTEDRAARARDELGEQLVLAEQEARARVDGRGMQSSDVMRVAAEERARERARAQAEQARIAAEARAYAAQQAADQAAYEANARRWEAEQAAWRRAQEEQARRQAQAANNQMMGDILGTALQLGLGAYIQSQTGGGGGTYNGPPPVYKEDHIEAVPGGG